MRAIIIASGILALAPAGCARMLSGIAHELGIAAEREGGAAARNAERDAADAAARTHPASWSHSANFDGSYYFLRTGGARISAYAIRAFMRSHGYSGSGSPDVDQDADREVATYRLQGTVIFTPLSCARADGSRYQVPRDWVACGDGRPPTAGAALDISAIPVE